MILECAKFLVSNNEVIRIGNKYEICGKDLPYLDAWAKEQAGLDIVFKAPK